MPSPIVPGGAPVGVPGAPPPGGPTGAMPVAAGFDALFQQLTGGTLGAALTAGAIAPAGERDGDAESGDEVETVEPSLEAVTTAAVPVPVPVPVVSMPIEWVWTPPVAAGIERPREDALDGPSAAPVLDAPAGPGWAAVVSPRSTPRETPVISPPVFPLGESPATSVVSVTPGREAQTEAAAFRVVEPMPPVRVAGAPMAETSPRGPVASAAGGPPSDPVDLGPVGPAPVVPASAPETAARSSSRPDGAAFAPEPSAAGIVDVAVAVGEQRTRPAGDVRQGRARVAAPEIGATETKDAAPSPVTFTAPAEASAPATPTRRPVPAGALAAMERLASTPVAPTGAAGAAASIRTEVSPTHGAAPVPPGHSGSSPGEGFGARREGSQPGPERVPTGPSFRLVDTPAAPFGLGAPGLERPAVDRPVGAAAEMAPVRELEPALADSVHQQIVRSIRMQWSGSLGEARVTLKPEFLGEVTASINVERGVVTATLHADTPEVRTFIESHAATLRDALVEHGLRLDRLEVAEPERESPPNHRQPGRRRGQQEAPPKPRRRDPEPDATFDFISE